MKSVLSFTVKIIQEKESKEAPFVAYSPELDIASAGSTKAQAKKNLSEAILWF